MPFNFIPFNKGGLIGPALLGAHLSPSSSAEYGLLCMFISCPSGSYQVPIINFTEGINLNLVLNKKPPIRGLTFSSFLPPPPSMNLGQVHVMSI